jgi:hypothetical protein
MIVNRAARKDFGRNPVSSEALGILHNGLRGGAFSL